MNVAAVTITYNDGFKFNEWYSHYLEYKDELYMHIIIDNGSEQEYVDKVCSTFTNSKIIKRTKNGGLTLAYNEGFRYALDDKNVDAIMVIANDVRIEKGSTTKLYNFLYSKSEFGMVAPIFLVGDSMIVTDYGCRISKYLYLKPENEGDKLEDVSLNERFAETVTGGMNMAKREFYEEVGLQDEKLFMYSDEVDLGLRAKASRFKIAVTKSALSWHQHINPENRKNRMPYVGFLISRNKIYLAYKHFNFFKALSVFFYQSAVLIRFLFRFDFKYNCYFLFGLFCGLFRIEKNFSFIIDNK